MWVLTWGCNRRRASIADGCEGPCYTLAYPHGRADCSRVAEESVAPNSRSGRELPPARCGGWHQAQCRSRPQTCPRFEGERMTRLIARKLTVLAGLTVALPFLASTASAGTTPAPIVVPDSAIHASDITVGGAKVLPTT